VETKKTFLGYKLHKIVRRTELLLFLLVLSFSFLARTDVKGSYIVAGVQSRVYLVYGEEVHEFDTYKTELVDAVKDKGIKIYDQDFFSIPRETRLNGQEVRVVITKSLPVVINDDGKHIVGRTVYSKPESILEQNDIRIWPEDILSVELITDPITAGGVGQLVTIKRAPLYTVQVDGKVKEVRTWDEEVKTIVEKSETKLNPNDIVSPGLNVKVASGAVIKITRINYAKVKENKTINFSTTYRYDYFLASGNQSTIKAGVDGKKELLYNVTYKNGDEVSRVLLSSKVLRNPITAIIKKGVMPSSDSDFDRTYWKIMVAAGQKYGISPLELFEVASCESHLNPNSTGGGGTYLGMYQYTLSFWKAASKAAGYTGATWNNATAQIYTTARYASIYGWGKWSSCAP
jgi:uncharacterized protein YabE (DUF348 family)